MQIKHAASYDEASLIAANLIAAQIILKPDSTLGLATGSSPIGCYEELIQKHLIGEISFADIKTINLDEYRGIDKKHNQSYYFFMHDKLFNHVDIKPENVNFPNGMAQDGFSECLRYNEKIKEIGPIDIQLLGIGENGHIGFNEPGNQIEKETHIVTLAPSTINANARFFNDINEVPKEAFTVGIKTILEAKKIILIATGEKKAKIIRDALYGPVTTEVPASFLQLHNDVTIVLDSAAFSEINKLNIESE